MSENGNDQAVNPGGGTVADAAAAKPGSTVLPVLALLLALSAAVLAGFQWYQNRVADEALRRDLAQRLAAMESLDKEAARRASQVAAALREAEIKLGVLESKLAESQNQQIALEALYQGLSRNRDERAFADIEQSVLLASQQLQIAANVRAALIGLEHAETRLQSMDQPRYGALRRALSRDIERLKALPLVDLYGISERLDGVISGIDRLPLAMDARARPDAAPSPEPAAQSPRWERMLREAWQELRQLVRVQSTGGKDSALLAPEQSFFLRENLKLRLLGARVALLSRDEKGYQGDLRAALAALERHFDLNDKAVTAAAVALRRLQSAQVSLDVPELAETLEALRKLRTARVPAPAR